MQPIKLLFIALLCATTCFTNCKRTPKAELEYFFYVDQAYFQYKQSQLLSCLENETRNDTCGCAEKYLSDGAAAPKVMFRDTLILSATKHEDLRCCPCQHLPACVYKCDGTGYCLDCPCPDPKLLIAMDDKNAGTLAFASIDPQKKVGGRVNVAITKRKRTIAGQDYYEFSLPSDFTAKVMMSYRGSMLGVVNFEKGSFTTWEPGTEFPCK